MRSTAIDRRQLLLGTGAGLAALAAQGPAGFTRAAQAFDAEDPLFAAARREADGSHSVVVTGLDGMPRAKVALPGRGHDVAVCPGTGRCLVFARRPGTFAVLFDPLGRGEPVAVAAVPGRHFYGHGAFSPDGRLVFATENDFEAARGVIGVYDLSGAAPVRVGEYWSGGVGPHDILPLADGKTLVVANGGIETHPDRGREKLNLTAMRPNITLIDRPSGSVLASFEAPAHLHRLSLRHMAAGGGKVWIGGQYEGPEEDTPPLVASLDLSNGRLALHDVPGALRGRLANYVGSVALSRDGEVVAASCPRAGRILYFSAVDGAFLGAQQRADACGLAPLDAGSFLISDGQGGLSDSAGNRDVPALLAASPGIAWDNHLAALGPA
jgi:hypothetical protein